MKRKHKVSRVAFGALATTALVGTGGGLAWADTGGHSSGNGAGASSQASATGQAASSGQAPAGGAGAGNGSSAASGASGNAGGAGSGGSGTANAGGGTTNRPTTAPAGAGGNSSGAHSPSGGGNTPPGNNGTVKIDEYSMDQGQDNDPHVPCGFSISFFGYDSGKQSASIAVTPVAPTSGGGTYTTGTSWTVSERTSGSQWDQNVPISGTDLAPYLNGVTPQPQQGYHLRLEVEVSGSQGSDDKYKVFWMAPCTTSGGSTTSPGGTSAGGGSTTGGSTTGGSTGTGGSTTGSGTTGSGTTGSSGGTTTPAVPTVSSTPVPVALSAGSSPAQVAGAAPGAPAFGSATSRAQLAGMTALTSAVSSAAPRVGAPLSALTGASTTSPASASASSLPSVLAFTGVDAGELVGGGSLLIGLGAATVAATSRRRRLGRARA